MYIYVYYTMFYVCIYQHTNCVCIYTHAVPYVCVSVWISHPGLVSAGQLAAQRHLRGRCRGQLGSGLNDILRPHLDGFYT